MEPWKFATPWEKARNAHVAAQLGLPPEQSHIVHVDQDGSISYTAASRGVLEDLYQRVVAAGLRPSKSLEVAGS